MFDRDERPTYLFGTHELCTAFTSPRTFDHEGYVQTWDRSSPTTLICSCDAFKLTQGCQHILTVLRDNLCFWDSLEGPTQVTPGVCPNCAGVTRSEIVVYEEDENENY